ncbi:hypothetical protein EON65_15630 [archaeon]|nr:MAG: hypothetical protein EON65_15630 [archaeon]
MMKKFGKVCDMFLNLTLRRYIVVINQTMVFLYFIQLNLDDELPPDAFDDQVVGPCKPGCNFFKFLGRGPPLHVPIPETIFIGSGNFIKLLHNEPIKGAITQEIMHFDHQEVRDEFITNCVNKFVKSSVPVTSPPEAIYSRFVAVQKKPAVKSNRAYINTQCDFLLPIAFQSQLLEITDNNLPPCVIQRFIKSRGRRPGVYRLFWKRAGNELGAAEGWNITKKAEEFKAPDLITLEPSTVGNAKANEDQNAEELEELTFKRQTTKFIASYIRAGESETQEDNDPLDGQIDKLTKEVDKLSKSFRPFSAPLAKRAIRASMQSAVSFKDGSEKDRTFLTSAVGGDASGGYDRAPSPKLTRSNTLGKSTGSERPSFVRQETAYTIFTEQRPEDEGDDTRGYEKKGRRRHSVDYFSSHSVEEIDELFLKGMLSKMYINPADRTRALLISAKVFLLPFLICAAFVSFLF